MKSIQYISTVTIIFILLIIPFSLSHPGEECSQGAECEDEK